MPERVKEIAWSVALAATILVIVGIIAVNWTRSEVEPCTAIRDVDERGVFVSDVECR